MAAYLYLGTNSRISWAEGASSEPVEYLRLCRIQEGEMDTIEQELIRANQRIKAFRRGMMILHGDDTKPDIQGVYKSAWIDAGGQRPYNCTVTRKGVKSPLFQE